MCTLWKDGKNPKNKKVYSKTPEHQGLISARLLPGKLRLLHHEWLLYIFNKYFIPTVQSVQSIP